MVDAHPRRHVGTSTAPSAAPAPAALVITDVGVPPLPLPPSIPIVDAQGRPTPEFHQWEMLVHQWRLKLYEFLGGPV